ncbi:putative Late nodulin [Medicago truncatula]|uniref:Nodule Cysteine-Rich (NCR) secreted peptide n=1 Tax=Medicago truncatula TaxID=3880 RepID=G7IW92_MEDTR|nr:Nodule Cysteine-Rich (NCR) secreted peptide [Medicago truncatula]RHN65905.1 putative Late nodulin [Medicago truncatula]
MTEILKFVCIMIIFLSSFIVSQNIDGNTGGNRKCFRDSDCPKFMCPSYLAVKCIGRLCRCGRPELQVELNPK